MHPVPEGGCEVVTVVHLAPIAGSGVSGCCGLPLFELPRDERVTTRAPDATCTRQGTVIVALDRRDASTAALSLGLPASGYIVVAPGGAALRGRQNLRVHVTRRAHERPDYDDICAQLVVLQRTGGLRHV